MFVWVFLKFNLSYSDILDLSQSPHGSCIGWRSVICCSFGSLLQLSVAWLLHPCWIVHCVCKYLLYCIMIHCAKGYCTGWHWIIHCLLWQSGAEGGNACERYEQKVARQHRRGLYVSPHHPSVICANCIFQHYMRLFNICMAVFTPSLHIQWKHLQCMCTLYGTPMHIICMAWVYIQYMIYMWVYDIYRASKRLYVS